MFGDLACMDVANDSVSLAMHPSVAVYTPARLAFYDVVILGFSCRFVWHSPKRRFLELYERHVGARHLDVGVGSGYFLDRCRFPVERPAITLLDLSEACLAKAARRIARYSPELRRANVLEPNRRVKVSRAEVYWIMLESSLLAGNDAALHEKYQRIRSGTCS